MGCVFGREASAAERERRREEVKVAKAEVGEVQIQNGGNGKEGGGEEKSTRPRGERRRSSKPNPRLSNPPNHLHGEQVAAGWPSWLSKVAGEAINGLTPRRADTFEKLDKVEQLHKIFKLCGSPSEEYWKKSKLPHATIFKPQQSYKRCIAETFKDFPPSSLPLIETLLTIDPAERQTATAALHSEFFTTKPYACEPSSLPKYPPSKEMDAKLRDEEARRLRAAGKANADGVKKSRPRDRGGRGIPVPEANAELQANIDRRRLITHANAKSKSEKFPPPHQDGTLGYPLGSSHHMDPGFDPPDVPFSSTNFSYPKVNIQTWSGPLVEPSRVGAPRRRKNTAGDGHIQLKSSKKDPKR